MRVTRTDQHHQRQAVTIAELVDLRAQPTTGAGHTMVRGFIEQIRVIRRCPLCGATGLRRVDAPGRPSNPRPPTNRYRLRRRPSPATPPGRHPRYRRRRSGDAASTPSARGQNQQADHARQYHSDTGRGSPRSPDDDPETAGPGHHPNTATRAQSHSTAHRSTPHHESHSTH